MVYLITGKTFENVGEMFGKPGTFKIRLYQNPTEKKTADCHSQTKSTMSLTVMFHFKLFHFKTCLSQIHLIVTIYNCLLEGKLLITMKLTCLMDIHCIVNKTLQYDNALFHNTFVQEFMITS